MKLTLRQQDIIRELCKDAPSNKEIAARIGLTTGTIKVYLSRIYEMAGMPGSRGELILWAVRNEKESKGETQCQFSKR